MIERRAAILLPGLGRVHRGAETALLEIGQGLARQFGWQVDAFGSGPHGTPELPIQQIGCVPRERFERWPKLPCFRGETSYEEFTFTAGLAFRGLYQSRRYDVVLGCSYPYLNWFARLARGRARHPLVIHVTQNGDWPCRRTNAEFRAFGCDGLVCINPEHHERHRGRYPSALIPNGVDPSVFSPRGDSADSEATWSELTVEAAGRPIVLMVSALIDSKRVVEAVAAVSAAPGCFLVVAGDGPRRADVEQAAASSLAGRHRLLGGVPRDLMPALYRRADVLLHMSQEEPFGIVYLEAAASGLAVIAHDSAVTRWILGDGSVLVDTSDLSAVAAGLGRALEPANREELGLQARQRVLTDWTWERQVGRYRDFLEQLLGQTA